MNLIFKRKYSLPILLSSLILLGLYNFSRLKKTLYSENANQILSISLDLKPNSARIIEKTLTRRIFSEIKAHFANLKINTTTTEHSVVLELSSNELEFDDNSIYLIKNIVRNVVVNSKFEVNDVNYAFRKTNFYESNSFTFLVSFNTVEDLISFHKDFSYKIKLNGNIILKSVIGLPKKELQFVNDFKVDFDPLIAKQVISTLKQSFDNQIIKISNSDFYIQHSKYSPFKTPLIQIQVDSTQITNIKINDFIATNETYQFDHRITLNNNIAIKYLIEPRLGYYFEETEKFLTDYLTINSKNIEDYFWLNNPYQKYSEHLFNIYTQGAIGLILTIIVLRLFYKSKLLIVLIFLTGLLSYSLLFSLLYYLSIPIDLGILLCFSVTFGILADNCIILYENLKDSKKSIAFILFLCTLTTVLFIPISIFYLPYLYNYVIILFIVISSLLLGSIIFSYVLLKYFDAHHLLPHSNNILSRIPIRIHPILNAYFSFRKKYWLLLIFICLLIVGLPVQLFEVKFGEPYFKEYKLAENILGGLQIRTLKKLGNVKLLNHTTSNNQISVEINKSKQKDLVEIEKIDNDLKQIVSNHTFNKVITDITLGRINMDIFLNESTTAIPILTSLHNYLSNLGYAQSSLRGNNSFFRYSNSFHKQSAVPTFQLTGYNLSLLEYYANKVIQAINMLQLSNSQASLYSNQEHFFPDDIRHFAIRNHKQASQKNNFESFFEQFESTFSSEIILNDKAYIKQKYTVNYFDSTKFQHPEFKNINDFTYEIDNPLEKRIESINGKYQLLISGDFYDITQAIEQLNLIKQIADIPDTIELDIYGYDFNNQDIELFTILYILLTVLILTFFVNTINFNSLVAGIESVKSIFIICISGSLFLILYNQELHLGHLIGLFTVIGLASNSILLLNYHSFSNSTHQKSINLELDSIFLKSIRPITISTITTIASFVPFIFTTEATIWKEFASFIVFVLPLSTLLIFLTYTNYYTSTFLKNQSINFRPQKKA